MQRSDDPRVGTLLAGYRLEELLGRGATGVVYLAEDVRLQRKVALRLLSPGRGTDEQFRERFLRESKLAASLDHPSIVPVLETGEVEGRLYVVMGYVESDELASLLAREGRLDPGRALLIVTQLAGALDAARWSRGLVHGDLRPDEVLVVPAADAASPEQVLLRGFGLRQELPPGATLADVARRCGTVDYLAPEQIEGKPVSPRSDVYALGCLLVACLTGRPLFEGDSPVAVLTAHLHEPPPSVTQRCPGLPAGIDGVIGKALAKWPEERYSTCQELAASAQAALSHGGGQPERASTDEPRSPVAPPPRPGPAGEEPPPPGAADGGPVVGPDRRRRKPVAAIALVVLVAALVAGTIWLTGGGTADPSSATPAPPDTGTPTGVAVDEGAATTETETAAEPEAPAPVADPVAPEPGQVSLGPGSLVRVDATTGEVLATVAIPFTPQRLAADDRSVWALVHGGTQLVRIETATNAVTYTFPRALWQGINSFAVADGHAWLGDWQGALSRLAPGENVAEPVLLDDPDGGGPLNYADHFAAAGSLWVSAFPPGPCCLPPPDLYRVDPSTGRVIARIDGAAVAVAAGTGFLWALDTDDPNADAPGLLRIDTETHATMPIGVLEFPWADLTVADGAVWASSPRDDTIVRLDAVTGEEEERIRLGGRPGALAAGGGAVWAVLDDKTVARYDIAAGRVETIEVGGTPTDLGFADGSVWAAVDDPATVDPGTASLPFLLDLRTGERTPLAESLAGGFNYVASPDGERVAYGTCLGEGCSGDDVVTVANIDGTVARALESPDGLDIYGARWSPDGAALVYQERDGADDSVGNLFVQDLFGRTQLTDLDLSRAWWWFLSPSFSSDGRTVLFHLARSPSRTTKFDVWSVPVTGGEPTLVQRNASFPMPNPELGPEWITMEHVLPMTSSFAGQSLMTSYAEGRGMLVEANDSIRWPTLSPDGERIAYQDDDAIYVVDASTGESSRVADGNTAEWLDDDTLIVAP